MQEIIGKLEMKHVADCLKDCLCYSVQIDGSTDKQQIDSKLIAARYVPVDEVCVKTVFLGISNSDLSGADGLLDSFLSCMGSVNCETSKLVGITTDGENANTGKNGGLWKLLKDHLGRELSQWMRNFLAVSTFFRTSPRRTKLLHQVYLKLFISHITLYLSPYVVYIYGATLDIRIIQLIKKERFVFNFETSFICSLQNLKLR